jgi:hypothetical protein
MADCGARKHWQEATMLQGNKFLATAHPMMSAHVGDAAQRISGATAAIGFGAPPTEGSKQ